MTKKLTSPADGVTVTIVGDNGVRWNAVTDAAGAVRVNGLPAGKYRIDVALAGTKTIRDRDVERLGDRGCAVATVRLVSDGQIEGRVIDKYGDAVEKIVVTLLPAAFTDSGEFPGVWLRTSVSDARGVFAFDGLPGGEYHLGANIGSEPDKANPYAPRWFASAAARSETTPIRLGNAERRSDVEITLGERLRPVKILGVVLNPDGTAAGGVWVHLKQTGVYMTTSRAAGKTNTDGEFALEGLEDIPYIVEASQVLGPGKMISAAAAVTATYGDRAWVSLTLRSDRK